MALPSMRPQFSSPLHRKLQLATKQRHHHNSAVFTAQNILLPAVVILTAHVSKLHTSVPAELCNVYCQTLSATRGLHAALHLFQAIACKQLLWTLVLLMPVCCSALQAACFLTAAVKLVLYQTLSIVCVLRLL